MLGSLEAQSDASEHQINLQGTIYRVILVLLKR